MRRVIGFVTVLILAASLPAEAKKNGFFAGGGIGQATVKFSEIDDEVGEIDFSGDDSGYKLFLGYRMLDFFAIQAEYVDFGTAEDVVGTAGDLRTAVDLSSFNAFAVGLLPLGPFDLFAKLGVVSWDADISATLDDITNRSSDDGTDPAYGLGVGLRFGSFAVRGEFEYFDVDDADDLYLISLSALYTF
jgi:OOP family OmpA-OmpF porin